MSQTPAGWYPSEGQERYWDGAEWTQHVRPIGGVAPNEHMPHVVTPLKSDPTAKPWYLQAWFIGVVAGFVGLALGVALAGGAAEADPTATDEYESQAEELEAAEDELSSAQDELDSTQDELESIAGNVPGREKAVEEAEAELEERMSALSAAEKDVARREKAVGIAEKEQAANTIPGEGVYRVGEDMKPGTYRSVDNNDCYWMISSDPNGSNIIQNNIVTGPALASVSAGQYFTTNRCGEWVLQ